MDNKKDKKKFSENIFLEKFFEQPENISADGSEIVQSSLNDSEIVQNSENSSEIVENSVKISKLLELLNLNKCLKKVDNSEKTEINDNIKSMTSFANYKNNLNTYLCQYSLTFINHLYSLSNNLKHLYPSNLILWKAPIYHFITKFKSKGNFTSEFFENEKKGNKFNFKIDKFINCFSDLEEIFTEFTGLYPDLEKTTEKHIKGLIKRLSFEQISSFRTKNCYINSLASCPNIEVSCSEVSHDLIKFLNPLFAVISFVSKETTTELWLSDPNSSTKFFISPFKGEELKKFQKFYDEILDNLTDKFKFCGNERFHSHVALMFYICEYIQPLLENKKSLFEKFQNPSESVNVKLKLYSYSSPCVICEKLFIDNRVFIKHKLFSKIQKVYNFKKLGEFFIENSYSKSVGRNDRDNKDKRATDLVKVSSYNYWNKLYIATLFEPIYYKSLIAFVSGTANGLESSVVTLLENTFDVNEENH